MATDDLDAFIRSMNAYRSFVQGYRWPGATMGAAMDDFYEQAQDHQPGRPMLTGKKGLRLVEEMTVYDADGTMLGYLTLSTALVEPRWAAMKWMTPVYGRVSVTREDIVRTHGKDTRA